MSEVRVFKMISGEEIIGKVEEENESGILMDRVRTLATVPAGNGQMQLSMIPFTVSNSECTILLKHEAFAGEVENPAEMLVTGYLEQTTGIVLAKNVSSSL